MSHHKTSRNDPCPCGSGKKYKACCYRQDVDAELAAGRRLQYPIGTVAMYGPDNQTTTKITAGVILHETADPIIERWVGTDIENDPKAQQQMKDFFLKYGVKQVVMCEGNMGCPHEEGEDFPLGEDCPFCPYWKGKQGSNQRE